MEQDVVLRIVTRQPSVDARLTEADAVRRVGERLADTVARVGGSWPFVIGFCVVLAVWVVLNGALLLDAGIVPFDPYPFIFLNLLLSMLAALQAPIIMMSQNRQAARDRRAASDDFAVNLRAELEIRRLHDRLDLWERHGVPKPTSSVVGGSTREHPAS